MPETLAHYTFVPWLRQGVSAHIEEADRLGKNPDAGVLGRATLSVELVVEYVPKEGGSASALPTLKREIQILGPGDIVGIKRNAVLRTEPYENAVNATPGELAFIEFYEEDFPWRYTPARVAASNEEAMSQHKLRPWLALFILRPDEFTLLEQPGNLPVVTINKDTALPPVEESWAWAHAQIGREITDPAEVPGAIAEQPDQSLSRLLCPRKLEPDTAYFGFLVPAFETGRLAGLCRSSKDVPAQKPSWGTQEALQDPRYPVYFRWNFKTSTSGDFEELVRKLVAGPVGPRFGKREMDISEAGYGMSNPLLSPVDFEGALRPPDFQRTPFPNAPGTGFVAQLQSIVDLSQELQRQGSHDLPHPLAPAEGRPSTYAPTLRPSGGGTNMPDDPIVTPPAYGRWHADVTRIADAASEAALAWLCELNLDPRSRAAAGLGTQVINQLQDEFIERAWKQVGEIEAANQRMREAELAVAAGEALYAKHFLHASDNRLLTLTAPAQRGIKAPALTASVRGMIASSRVPTAAQSSPFKRISRPQRKVMRRLTGTAHVGGLQVEFLSRMNLERADALSTARPKDDPRVAIGLGLVTAAVTAALDEAATRCEPKQWFLELLQNDLAARRAKNEDLARVGVQTLRASVGTALASHMPAGASPEERALAGRVQSLIDAITDVKPDGPDSGIVTIAASAFALEFGDEIHGKAFRGVTAVSSSAPPLDAEIARTASVADLQAYKDAFSQFSTDFVRGRPLPAFAVALPPITDLAGYVLEHLRPQRNVTERMAAALPGLRGTIIGRSIDAPRQLRPIMASPLFEDPMFEPLRCMSQDYILPNVSDLPKDTITLMEPNTQFIEAYLAGLNVEMARELLWREYPTDQRGTCFRTFWDTRDAIGHPARPDIKRIHEWTGELGDQSQLPPNTLVLVIRGEVLQKYPNTVVYAQEAEWTGGDPLKPRKLKEGGTVKYPAFHANLEPDIAIFGFDLAKADARGHRKSSPNDPLPDRPGWFFVLKERPGQLRFGADQMTPATGFGTWDDLAWDKIPMNATYVAVSADAPTPANPAGVVWGKNAAHQAYAMFQSPVLYARHAAEMLPSV